MALKIVTIIACMIAALKAMKAFEKCNTKAMFSNGFMLLTMATLARVFF